VASIGRISLYWFARPGFAMDFASQPRELCASSTGLID
jgi:hypothetical protein